MNRLIVLVPREAAGIIRDGGGWGHVTVKVSDAENAGYVRAVSVKREMRLPVTLAPKTHFLNSGEDRPAGFWYWVRPELHVLWADLQRRQSALTVEGFAGFVPSGFKVAGGGAPYIAITYAPDVESAFPGAGVADLVAWHVSADGVEPVDVECEPEVVGNAQLAARWPVDLLAATTVIVVGVGSIGGATVHALASYGIGRLLLVDPDRLRWHNLVRHVCGPAHVGKMKVSALRDDLRLLRPDTNVEAYPLDVVAEADQIRPLLSRTDLVVCAADAVASRRVVSHLARRAGRDAVLACVLEDGGLGEVLRLRPWRDRGCLVCQRQALAAAGAIDPEPNLDAGYGTGTRHRAMTAVGGDLHLVGQLAAKISVATVLERGGHPDQRLPGEHSLLALRPQPGWAPPFDLSRAGEIRWLGVSAPLPDCPTCEDP
ncbi:ThiF family adenylyltransferase [Nonomuraea sp. NPDC049625]|uniref:HesA/MoeB/ThiF family protein n=1 Tax=Nonomuraea sp. NPDC049625 TaxID=3155775 RepID=UPI00341D3A13